MNWKEKVKEIVATKEFKFCAIGVVVLVVLGIIVSNNTNSSVSTTTEESSVSAESETDTENTELTAEELEEQLRSTIIEADNLETLKLGNVSLSTDLEVDVANELQEMQDNLDKAYMRNALLFLITGESDEDMIAEIYNKDYQTYCEWPNDTIEVYYDRGKCIQVVDKLYRVQNVTPLDKLQAVLDLAKANTDGVSVEITTQDIYNSDLVGDDSEFTEESTEAAESVEDETEAEAEAEDGDTTSEESTEASEVEESSEGESQSEEETETRSPDDVYLYTQKAIEITIEHSALKTYFDKLYDGYYDEEMALWDELRDSENDTEEDDYLIYSYVTTNLDDTFGAGEYVVIDGQEFISWYFDTYYSLNDWSINKEDFIKEATAQDYIDNIKELQEQVSVISEQLQQTMASREAEVESLTDELESESESEDVENLESAGANMINALKDADLSGTKAEETSESSENAESSGDDKVSDAVE